MSESGASNRGGISFITYTYNDHRLVRDLLGYLKYFQVPFAEIVVVDDASSVPFILPENAPPQARVLRLPENVGPGQAKRAGLNALSHDIFFSLDADIRPHAGWLLHALNLVTDPGVGLVGGSCAPSTGASYHARARKKTFVFSGKDREAPVVPGGCMLLRRDVWQRVGGLEDYRSTTFEDYHFCRKLHQAGLRIIRCDSLPVYETRHLHRAVFCRRKAFYNSTSAAPVIRRHGAERYLADRSASLEQGLAYAEKSGDPVLVYAWLLESLLVLCQVARKAEQEAPPLPFTAHDVLCEGANIFSGFPGTLALFADDLLRAGEKLPDAPDSGFPPLAHFFAPAMERNIPAMLEEIWVSRYRDEDDAMIFDGHYTEENTE